MTEQRQSRPIAPKLVGPAAIGLALLLHGDGQDFAFKSWIGDGDEPPPLSPVARTITLPAPTFGEPGNPSATVGRDLPDVAESRAAHRPPQVSQRALLKSTASDSTLAARVLPAPVMTGASKAEFGLAEPAPPLQTEAVVENAPAAQLPAPQFAIAASNTPPIADEVGPVEASAPEIEIAQAAPALPVARPVAEAGAISAAPAPELARVPPAKPVETAASGPTPDAAESVAMEEASVTGEPVRLAANTTGTPAAGAVEIAPLIKRTIASRSAGAASEPLETEPASEPSAAQAAPQMVLAAPVRVPSPAPKVSQSPPKPAVVEAQTAEPEPASLLSGQGTRTFPVSADTPIFGYDDELILEIRVAGATGTDTVIAYGNRDGVYLPLGMLARILDLAIKVGDDGNYASGWFLSQDQTVTINLREQTIALDGKEQPLPPGLAQAFDGELYLRSEVYAEILPLTITPNLRNQSIDIETLTPFPFEERMKRDAERARLANRGSGPAEKRWPREETPWLPLSFPIGDVEFRAISDTARGERLEGDLRLAADVAYMTGQAYLSVASDEGLVASIVSLGRRDADGDLLGPLRATEFTVGDVATYTMPMGLRGTFGRGASITNAPFEAASVFDQIDLRGVLLDGYEVELYRNGILIGSTDKAVNGQYEFLQVPVDFGTNVFRLVFYGPQGQRSEEVRRINVGDGRLAKGDFVYQISAAQSRVNVFDVQGPSFIGGENFGEWQANAQLSYGFSSAVTAVATGAFFESEGRDRWLATAGLRTAIGGFAVRADAGVSDLDGHAIGVGIGGNLMGGAFTLSHTEYGGGFVDETRSATSAFLRRATELDFNASLDFGSAVVPIIGRARHVELQDGQIRTDALVRGSARANGLLVSKTFEYSENKSPGLPGIMQVSGSFDLATLNRSRLQARAGLSYTIEPEARLDSGTVNLDYAIDDRTIVSTSANYAFANKTLQLGLSAIREFDKFTLALEGSYGVGEDDYAVGLRLGFSFGHDPLRSDFYIAKPGQSAFGALALRAFQDLDGDNVYGPGDTLLPEVGFASTSQQGTTDADGVTRLDSLGDGNRVSVRVDTATLPDILMSPRTEGIEIVPRPGRIHRTDFAIVGLSEVEGTATFADGQTNRGVSGVRLQMLNRAKEPVAFSRTEVDGYFFFEQVPPGDYEIVIDKDQAASLDICLPGQTPVAVPAQSDILTRDLTIVPCE